MRLIKRLAGLEAAVGGADEDLPPTGIVWSQHETKVDPDTLQAGEYVAIDIEVQDPPRKLEAGDANYQEPLDDIAPVQHVPQWIVRERVTREVNDLGNVTNAAGVAVGVVMRVHGNLIRWETLADAGAGGAA